MLSEVRLKKFELEKMGKIDLFYLVPKVQKSSS